MGLRKGMTNNPAGRPKKSLTKLSSELRESIVEFLADNFDLITREFDKVADSHQKIKLFIDLMSFALPRLRSTESAGLLGNLSTEDLQQIVNQLKEYYNETAGTNS